jgi:hypothetical protein
MPQLAVDLEKYPYNQVERIQRMGIFSPRGRSRCRFTPQTERDDAPRDDMWEKKRRFRQPGSPILADEAPDLGGRV